MGRHPVTDPNAPVPPPAAPTSEGQTDEEMEMDEEIDINALLESLRDEEENEEDDDESFLKEGVPVKTSAIGGKVGGSPNKKPSADAFSSSHIETTSKSVKSGKVGFPDGKKIHNDPAEGPRPNQAKNATKTNLSTPGGALKEAASVKSGKVGYPTGKKTSTSDDPTVGVDRPNEGPVTKDSMSTPSLKKENAELKKTANRVVVAISSVKNLKSGFG
jgi:hypothetical protein